MGQVPSEIMVLSLIGVSSLMESEECDGDGCDGCYFVGLVGLDGVSSFEGRSQRLKQR